PGDTFNNILSIQVAPNGDKIVYTYATNDVTGQYSKGDLIGVTHEDSSNNVTTSITLRYGASQPHFLTKIIGGNNVPLLTVDYDPITGRITSITDANGNESPFTAPTSVAGGIAEKVSNAAKFDTINVCDDYGNV